VAGEYFHVLARGNARQSIFLDEVDREIFLETLDSAVTRFGLRCHAYCLMGNHYHLLVQPTEPDLSSGVRHLNGTYGQEFNRRHRRVGHVFAGRFKSLLIGRDSYLLQLAKYIALNPVRAGLVSTADMWPWSHHRAMAGIIPAPSFLTTVEILRCFNEVSPAAAQRAYQDFVASGDPDDEMLRDPIARGGVLGDQALFARMAPVLDRYSDDREIPRRERLVHRPMLKALFELPLTRRQRNDQIRLAHEVHRYTMGEIARHLRIGRATVARALTGRVLSHDDKK
jgi:REP element-mobilizing transposase RayT